MSKFFINRPIVAMVISLLLIIVGLVAMAGLPVSQFPNIIPPEIWVRTTYVGADAETVEKSVAQPIEQQMSGVDNMNYMYSLNSNNGTLRMYINFDVKTDPNTDLILTQMRQNQAQSQLPLDVRNFGVTVQKSLATQLMNIALYSPNGTHTAAFLANYAYINLYDQVLRVPGVASITVFGAGQYAMRIWVKPDTLAKLGISVPDIINAVQKQNTVNPSGQIGGEPAPPGQEFTYSVRAQGRLISEEEFGRIVVRANPDGSMVRLADVARIELGTQDYNVRSRLNGRPAANIAVYPLPGSNAIATAQGVRKLMAEVKGSFPTDLEYAVTLDTTRAVTEGIREITKTLFAALLLVILVIFLFLQGWRATLIPTLAVPVSLIGTLAVFPLLGFSINTLSLFGLVLAIGLVVDDAIVVVEAVERHMEEGLSPKEATLRTMEEVSGPVTAIALIFAAVFIPTVFIPGITGRLYQQFAVTIAISVLLSAFNALTLTPGLCALILRPRKEGRLLGSFFRLFNRAFGAATSGYVGLCGRLIRKSALALLFLVLVAALAGLLTRGVPTGFLPEEDQGYFFVALNLPDAASLQRTDLACRKVEQILRNTPEVQYYMSIAGFNLLNNIMMTSGGFFIVTLKDWKERERPEERAQAIMSRLNRELAQMPQSVGFAFSPPAIPGIGTAGGVTFVLQDRAGKDISFLAETAAV